MNRFVWQADEFDIDEAGVEEAHAGLGEGRHSWNPGDHPRDDDGQFANGGGRMPDTIASSTVPLSGGNLTLGRHPDGRLSISTGHGIATLDKATARDFSSALSRAPDQLDVGDEHVIARRQRQADGSVHSTLVGSITRTGDDSYQIRAVGGDPTADELAATPGVTAKGADLDRISQAFTRSAAASRIDTGNGDLDLSISDDNKFAFRTPGENGPVEVKFDPQDYRKIDRAINTIIDNVDLADDPEDAVRRIDVDTGLGTIRVEMHGPWQGSNPGDRLAFGPPDDSWGVVIDGPHQSAWSTATGRIEDAGENLEIYDPLREGKRPMRYHNLSENVTLTEAAGGAPPQGRRFRARIIQGDIQGSSGYYPAEMLKRDANVFHEGLAVFLDHPGATESYDRPERSVRDLAGRLASPAVYEGDGLYADVEVYPHWAPVIEAMADHIGMSIRASGTVEASTDDNVRGPIVTSLAEATSVDFVTAAGAGGKIVALLESARSESELLRQAAEALAPPFKKKGAKDDKPATAADKAADDAEDAADGGDDEDEENADGTKKDDKFPAFLKKKIKAKTAEAKVSEARNVGHWLESRVHRAFTEMADDMFGEGRLSRDERIGLSSAIGEGLNAFNSRIADQMPHLYERDLWDEPGPAATPEDAAPAEAADKNEPGSSPADTKDKEGEMPEFTEAKARELEEARTTAETDKAAALQEAATAKQAAADADLKLARFYAVEAARPIATTVLAESTLPAAAQTKLLAAITSDSVPLTGENLLDEAAFKSGVEEAAKVEATYLASLAEGEGAGRPRGLGESATAGSTAQDAATFTALQETYLARGLSPAAAKLAAAGRP